MRPSAASVAEPNMGAVPSTVELLVTVVADKETASLPAVSWIAAFVVPASTAGALYAIVTAFPLPIDDAKVRITVVVEPLAATEDTVTGEPFDVTANALAGARGSRRSSL